MAGAPTEVVVEENSEPLKYKTWVLRVSIHCEGCKRKVKKILHSVDGVYTIDVDSKLHKVIVTGNVDSNNLIRKLEKSGKHAQLWSKSQEQGNHNPNVDQPHKNDDAQPPPGISNSDNGNGQQVKQVRFEENIPAAGDPNKPPEDNPAAQNGGGGAKKKKKKRKGNNNSANNNNSNANGENAGEQQPDGGPQSTESQPHPQPHHSQGPPPGSNQCPNNTSPPRQPQYNRVYEYPPTHYAPPAFYAVSYNTAHPSSYTASYYSAPPPYSYAYVQQQAADVEPHPPSDWSYPSSTQPSDTFEMFSDENPNACSVM